MRNYDILLREATTNPVLFFERYSFKDLQRELHPDRWIGSDLRAKDFFVRLSGLHDLIKEPKDRYLIGKGDLCNVFLSKCGEKVIKEPFVKAVKFLKKEEQVLKYIREGLSNKNASLFPEVIEQTPKEITFKAVKAEPLLSLIDRKTGVNSKHYAWIARRSLLALSLIHAKDICHGAVTPDHLLVDGADHGIVLIDWKHSGKVGEKIIAVPKKYASMYSLAKKDKKLSKALDISMLGSTMRQVVKNCPKKLEAFFKYMEVGKMDNASIVDDELKEALVQVFGPPKWVDLD